MHLRSWLWSCTFTAVVFLVVTLNQGGLVSLRALLFGGRRYLSPSFGWKLPSAPDTVLKPLRSVLDTGSCFFSGILSAASLQPQSSWNWTCSWSATGEGPSYPQPTSFILDGSVWVWAPPVAFAWRVLSGPGPGRAALHKAARPSSAAAAPRRGSGWKGWDIHTAELPGSELLLGCCVRSIPLFVRKMMSHCVS